MKYLVIEIQKLADGTVAIPPIASYDNYFDALSRYHTVLAAAAISSVPVHSCVLMSDVGQTLRMDSYDKTEGANQNEV